MKEKYVFLGFPLSPDAPSPPAIPPVQLKPFLTLEKDSANVTMLQFTSHTGTHLDTPGHVEKDGLRLTDFDASDFVFHSPLVIDLPMTDAQVVQPEDLLPFVDRAQEVDLLMFRFGYGIVRRMDPKRYSLKSPGFGVESAQFLLDYFPKLRALGMDVPSLSCIETLEQTFPAHNILLKGVGRKFLVIEDMNLEQELSGLAQVFVAPLLVEKIDGNPATIIGVIR